MEEIVISKYFKMVEQKKPIFVASPIGRYNYGEEQSVGEEIEPWNNYPYQDLAGPSQKKGNENWTETTPDKGSFEKMKYVMRWFCLHPFFMSASLFKSQFNAEIWWESRLGSCELYKQRKTSGMVVCGKVFGVPYSSQRANE